MTPSRVLNLDSKGLTYLKQRVKKREGKTQIFGFWAGQSGQIFLAGYIWAVKSSHRWQHLWAKVKI